MNNLRKLERKFVETVYRDDELIRTTVEYLPVPWDGKLKGLANRLPDGFYRVELNAHTMHFGIFFNNLTVGLSKYVTHRL